MGHLQTHTVQPVLGHRRHSLHIGFKQIIIARALQVPQDTLGCCKKSQSSSISKTQKPRKLPMKWRNVNDVLVVRRRIIHQQSLFKKKHHWHVPSTFCSKQIIGWFAKWRRAVSSLASCAYCAGAPAKLCLFFRILSAVSWIERWTCMNITMICQGKSVQGVTYISYHVMSLHSLTR